VRTPHAESESVLFSASDLIAGGGPTIVANLTGSNQQSGNDHSETRSTSAVTSNLPPMHIVSRIIPADGRSDVLVLSRKPRVRIEAARGWTDALETVFAEQNRPLDQDFIKASQATEQAAVSPMPAAAGSDLVTRSIEEALDGQWTGWLLPIVIAAGIAFEAWSRKRSLQAATGAYRPGLYSVE
jgi:hypothetical protein